MQAVRIQQPVPNVPESTCQFPADHISHTAAKRETHFSKNKSQSKQISTSNPTVTYFRLLQMEKTLRLNNRLMPTTKKKVQISKEAIPNLNK